MAIGIAMFLGSPSTFNTFREWALHGGHEAIDGMHVLGVRVLGLSVELAWETL